MQATHASAPATCGKVYLIGAGPGAADLITVRGARLLAQADVVLHDALVTEDMLALCPQALKIAVGKRCGKLSTAQQFINKQLVDNARKYALVVRLKGRRRIAGAGKARYCGRSGARHQRCAGGRGHFTAAAHQARRSAQRGLLYFQHRARRIGTGKHA